MNVPPVQPVRPDEAIVGGAWSNTWLRPTLLSGSTSRTTKKMRDTHDVPPHADVAEEGDELHAERVEHAVRDQHDA